MTAKGEWKRDELEKIVGECTAITIPVDAKIEAEKRVLCLDEIRTILEKAEVIALGECMCRRDLANCDYPLDVCITLDREATETIKAGLGKRVDLNTALAALERSHKAGLVHLAYEFRDGTIPIVCSCCACCCHHMSAILRFGYRDAVVKSAKIVRQDASRCISCGTCVERCQFEAWSIGPEQAILDDRRCFGCGLCVSTCPAGALCLEER